jgi:hypothetical protein
VACRALAATAAVFELGIFLESMLPRGGPVRVPGALRYVIARALLEVDAPPFDSVAGFTATLARHEKGDRSDVVRALFTRSAAIPTPPLAFPGDRRKRAASATELRRHLRAADEELFLRRAADKAPVEPAIDGQIVLPAAHTSVQGHRDASDILGEN